MGKHKPDVIFPIVHGTFGEDGTLQALLDIYGKPYVGSGVLASALCMDKVLSSELVEKHGLLIPKIIRQNQSGTFLLTNEEGNSRQSARMILPKRALRSLGEAWVVKPRASGSSVGVSIVRKKSELARALRLASKESEPMVQEMIVGIEVTCTVLDFPKAKLSRKFSFRALPVTEIIPDPKVAKFFDYKAKYTKGGSLEVTPARISPALTKAIQQASILAHQLLGCRHISRSDFIISTQMIGHSMSNHLGKVYYLETNTAPGMTDTSLVPQAAQVAGLPMPELVHQLIQGACFIF